MLTSDDTTLLLDLLTQFENHYFVQLHRHQQPLETLRGAMREATDSTVSFDEFNEDISFRP